jgi:hypothetical protein
VLGLTTVLVLLDPASAGAGRWASAGLAAAMAAWHFLFRRLGNNEERPSLVLGYLAGLLALWFVLAGIHPPTSRSCSPCTRRSSDICG